MTIYIHRVIDFVLVPNDAAAPKTLLILAEEEMVAVDMTDDACPSMALPYLNAIHASAVTCLAHAADVDKDLYERLTRERVDNASLWPATGGQVEEGGHNPDRDLLVTGHEDGSVRVWECSGVSLAPLATIKTGNLFTSDELDERSPGEKFGFFQFSILLCLHEQIHFCRGRRGGGGRRGMASFSQGWSLRPLQRRSQARGQEGPSVLGHRPPRGGRHSRSSRLLRSHVHRRHNL